jgi:hypothetical protein
MSDNEGILAWHFIPEDRLLRYGDGRLVEAGKTYTVDPPVVLCTRGLHASVRAIDALKWSPGPVVCRVRLSGEVAHGDDKTVATSRHVIWVADAKHMLYGFACDVAESALGTVEAAGGVVDPRSRDAIRVRRLWLVGKATDEESSAAESAAWSAAWSAAESAARSAAWSAAESAARSAAWSAAWSAA